MPKQQIGANGGVLVEGRNVGGYAKSFSATKNMGVEDSTGLQPTGYAQTFIQALATGAISLKGMLPSNRQLAAKELELAFGTRREDTKVLLAPYGFEPTYLAAFARAIPNTLGLEGMTPNITSYNQDYVAAAGLRFGTMLQSPQGADSAAVSETQLWTFTDLPASTLLRVFASGASGNYYEFAPNVTTAALKTAIQAMPAYTGRIVTITDARTTTTTDPTTGETLYNGTLTFAFDGNVDVPALAVTGSERFRITFNSTPAARNVQFKDAAGANLGTAISITPGMTAAALQAAVRALGAPYVAAVVSGSTTAVSGAGSPIVSGAGDAAANGSDYTLQSADNYTRPGNVLLSWAGSGHWQISINGAPSYQANGVQGTVPTSGWTVSGGNAPAPTVSVSAGGTSNGAYAIDTLTNTLIALPTNADPDVAITEPQQGGATATNIYATTPTQGGSQSGLNIVSAAFNGTAVYLPALDYLNNPNAGAALLIEVPYASNNLNATVRLQHADDSAGAPGSFSTVNNPAAPAVQVINAVGAFWIDIPAGVVLKDWMRVAISVGQITGELAFAVAYERNSPQ